MRLLTRAMAGGVSGRLGSSGSMGAGAMGARSGVLGARRWEADNGGLSPQGSEWRGPRARALKKGARRAPLPVRPPGARRAARCRTLGCRAVAVPCGAGSDRRAASQAAMTARRKAGWGRAARARQLHHAAAPSCRSGGRNDRAFTS